MVYRYSYICIDLIYIYIRVYIYICIYIYILYKAHIYIHVYLYSCTLEFLSGASGSKGLGYLRRCSCSLQVMVWRVSGGPLEVGNCGNKIAHIISCLLMSKNRKLYWPILSSYLEACTFEPPVFSLGRGSRGKHESSDEARAQKRRPR